MSYIYQQTIFLISLCGHPACWASSQWSHTWGAVRKNIISDRFSTKTAISARI